MYRAIDQFGQVIYVFVSRRRDLTAARRFLERAIGVTKVLPVEITSDQARVYPAVLGELVPAAWHRTGRYGQQPGRVRPWPAEGAAWTDARSQARSQRQRVILAGHAFVQNIRRGHYELAVEEPATRRMAFAFAELTLTI
jgi:transposase, IS6 family